MKKIVIYSDIHGCFEEFLELRKLIGINKNDIEIVTGDFINKGPFSLKTLRYIKQNNILSVIGNNESKMIMIYEQYKKDGEKFLDTIKAHEKETFLSLHDSDIKYLKSLPYFLKSNDLTVVHGGLFNHIKLDKPLSKEDKKYIMYLRFLDKDYNFLPFNDFENRYIFWSEIYDNHEGFIVYGHHPFKEPKIDRYSIGIDTGCVYGGKLSAVTFPIKNDKAILDQYKIFSVDAKKAYWQ